MSYSDIKITQANINENNVRSASDILIGNADDNKAVFDKLPEYIAGKHNELVDALEEVAEETQGDTEAIEKLSTEKLNSPMNGFDPAPGNQGDVLTSEGNGRTQWTDRSELVSPWLDVHGEELIGSWLDEHPEATTTVQDGAITFSKFNRNVNGALYNAVVGSNNFSRVFRYIAEYGTPVNGQGGCAINKDRYMYAICYPDHVDNKVLLIEYDRNLGEIVRTATVITGHNDVMTYNPDTNELYICPLVYYTSSTGGRNWRSILVYDYDTLTLKREISSVEADGVAYDRTTKKTYYYDFSYIMHEINMETESTTELFPLTRKVSNQSIAVSDGFVYFCSAFPNNVEVYDLDGTSIANIPIRHSYSYYTVGELEWFDIVDGVCIFGSKSYTFDGEECLHQVFETDFSNESVQYVDNYSQQLTVYVDATNTSANPNGTESNPFKTLGEASLYVCNALHINDIQVKSGTYSASFRRGVTLRSYEGETVTFDQLVFDAGTYCLERSTINTLNIGRSASCYLNSCDTSSANVTVYGNLVADTEVETVTNNGTFIDNTTSSYAKLTQSDYNVAAWAFVKTNNVVFLKIEATTLTTNKNWVAVSNGYPKPKRNYFIQIAVAGGKAVKFKLDTTGTLSISNVDGISGIKIDTTLSYPVI